MIRQVPLANILPNPFQPKSRNVVPEAEAKALALDIFEHGMHYIPKARPRSDLLPLNGCLIYEMADGWRRKAAHEWLALNGHPGCDHMPLDEVAFTDEQMADIIHSANDLHKIMTVIERAEYYKQYIEKFGITQGELGKRQGCSQSEIANTIRLLDLPEAIQAKVISQEISETIGRYLLRLNNHPELQNTLLKEAIKNGWSKDRLNEEIENELYHASRCLEPQANAFYDPPKFDLTACQDCQNSIKIVNPHSKQKMLRCSKLICWDEKQKAALAAIALTTEKQAPLIPETKTEEEEHPDTTLNTTPLQPAPDAAISLNKDMQKDDGIIPAPIQGDIKPTLDAPPIKYFARPQAFDDLEEVFARFDITQPGALNVTMECLIRAIWTACPEMLEFASVKGFIGGNYSHKVLSIKDICDINFKASDEDIFKFLPRLAFDFLQHRNSFDESMLKMMLNKFRKYQIPLSEKAQQTSEAPAGRPVEHFDITLDNGQLVKVDYTPSFMHHLEFHSKAISETGYRSDFSLQQTFAGQTDIPMETVKVEAKKLAEKWMANKTADSLYVSSQEEEHHENMLQQKKCDKCSGYRTDPEHRCRVHRWDCPKGPDIDFTTLDIKTAQAPGELHVFSCSGKTAKGEDFRDATIALCRELRIKFDSPASLADLLKIEFPQSRERDRLINNIAPVKVGA